MEDIQYDPDIQDNFDPDIIGALFGDIDDEVLAGNYEPQDLDIGLLAPQNVVRVTTMRKLQQWLENQGGNLPAFIDGILGGTVTTTPSFLKELYENVEAVIENPTAAKINMTRNMMLDRLRPQTTRAPASGRRRPTSTANSNRACTDEFGRRNPACYYPGRSRTGQDRTIPSAADPNVRIQPGCVGGRVNAAGNPTACDYRTISTRKNENGQFADPYFRNMDAITKVRFLFNKILIWERDAFTMLNKYSPYAIAANGFMPPAVSRYFYTVEKGGNARPAEVTSAIRRFLHPVFHPVAQRVSVKETNNHRPVMKRFFPVLQYDLDGATEAQRTLLNSMKKQNQYFQMGLSYTQKCVDALKEIRLVTGLHRRIAESLSADQREVLHQYIQLRAQAIPMHVLRIVNSNLETYHEKKSAGLLG